MYPIYSYLNDSTGFLEAVLQLCQLTVRMMIASMANAFTRTQAYDADDRLELGIGQASERCFQVYHVHGYVFFML